MAMHSIKLRWQQTTANIYNCIFRVESKSRSSSISASQSSSTWLVLSSLCWGRFIRFSDRWKIFSFAQKITVWPRQGSRLTREVRRLSCELENLTKLTLFQTTGSLKMYDIYLWFHLPPTPASPASTTPIGPSPPTMVSSVWRDPLRDFFQG